MKKFITTIPLQIGEYGLKKVIYKSVENDKLDYCMETAFPIICVINGYVTKGEKIEILMLKQKGEGTEKNEQAFMNEISVLSREKGFSYVIKVIDIVFDESVATHLLTFKNIIKEINNRDYLYACMTYGTKPIPIVEMMALNYAYCNLLAVKVECIVYGQSNRSKNEHKIYDITSLFAMDEIVHEMANKNVSDPLMYIEQILEWQ